MTAVWSTPFQSAPEKLVMLALADCADDDGKCWPSLRRLSTKCDLSRQGLINILKKLEAGDWLKVERENGEHQSNTYFLNLPKVVNVVDQGGGQRGGPKWSTWLTKVVNGVAHNHNRTIIEPSVPPIVPQGGQRKGKKIVEVSDAVKGVASRFWERNPDSKPIGEVRIRKELRDLEVLLASGVSEDQISRARDLLGSDDYRRSWVSCLGKMAEKWPQITSQLNGHLKALPENQWEHGQLS